MLATADFKMRMVPETKQKLAFLASLEGRSKAKMIDRLILEKYENVTAQKADDTKPSQEQPAAVA